MWQWWVLNILIQLFLDGLPHSLAIAAREDQRVVESSIESLSNDSSIESVEIQEFEDRSEIALYQVNRHRPAMQNNVVIKAKEEKKLEWIREKMLAKNQKSELPEEIQATQELIRLPTEQVELNETCKASVYRHKIRIAGCLAKNIYNRFCHGTCASFFVPTIQSSKLKAAFRSCSSCVPVETYVHQVTLECPDRPEGYVVRDIIRVKRCECRNIEISNEIVENE